MPPAWQPTVTRERTRLPTRLVSEAETLRKLDGRGPAAASPALARAARHHTVAPLRSTFPLRQLAAVQGLLSPFSGHTRLPALPLPGGPTCNTPKVHW